MADQHPTPDAHGQGPEPSAAAYVAEPAVVSAIEDWRGWLAHERRASRHTVDAYGRDVAAFLRFLAGHLGFAAGWRDLDGLTPADFRSYLASRAGEGLGRERLRPAPERRVGEPARHPFRIHRGHRPGHGLYGLAARAFGRWAPPKSPSDINPWRLPPNGQRTSAVYPSVKRAPRTFPPGWHVCCGSSRRAR